MAKLEEYIDFIEKEKWFDSDIVNNFPDFEIILKKIEEVNKSVNLIFRGCGEAKYKIYNSAQRHCITNDLYTNAATPKDVENYYVAFISNLIDECKNWNNGVVKKLFSSSKIHPNNAVAYLSLMQHFGIPSPFLDFTYDPYVALFFAIDNLNCTASNNVIDNYFSLYYTYTDRPEFEGWEAIYDANIIYPRISYEHLNIFRMNIVKPTNKKSRIMNNLNIINQKGLFFYNAHPSKPIEESYVQYVNEMKKNPIAATLSKAMLNPKFAFCINIHKSLAPNILDILKAKGITKDFIYPDTYKMKDSVIHNATASINKVSTFL